MARGLGLLSLVASLAIAGYILNAQLSTQSKTRKQQSQLVTMAQETGANVALQQAATALDQEHAINGTFAGATLGGFGVTLVRADTSSYCVQTSSNGQLFHLAGPGGTATPGSC